MNSVAPLIAAAIIVKDEADHLRRCLGSIRELCDDIVVVDTGSSDDTVEVALSFGATVLRQPWDGDFSAARNLGLDAIDADWILYIDADEEVQGLDIATVRQTLKEADGVAGFLVKFAVQVGWTPYWEHRIWRHRPDVRFRGVIHETMVPDLRRIVSEEGQRFERIELFMQHYGYEGDQRTKHERNLPMLLEQVENAPRRVYLWNHLGRVQSGLGRLAEAEASWQRGVEIVREDGLREPVDILIFGSMALHLINVGRDATAVIREGLALDGQHHTLNLALARQLMVKGQWRDALVPLTDLIGVDEKELNRSVLAYSRDMFTLWPWRMLAECHFELGEFAEAAEAYDRAAVEGADTLEMRTKATVSRSLAGQTGLRSPAVQL